MKKKYLVVIILFAFLKISAQSAVAPTIGSGTENDPYHIQTLEHLFWLAAESDIVPVPNQEARWSGYYIQTNNIDAAETETWFGGQGWSSIGNNTTAFHGNYDGQNYLIVGLYINGEKQYTGFFGHIMLGAISNVVLKNSTINGINYTGGLAGRVDRSVVTGCSFNGDVNASEDYVGGLIGYATNITLANSFALGTVSGSSSVGGLVGEAHFSDIIGSANKSNINAGSMVGGLVAYLNGSVVNKSYNKGNISSAGSNTGGVAGWVYQSSINSSYNKGNITTQGSNTGGLVGNLTWISNISDSFSISEITAEGNNIGGLVGTIEYQPSITHSYAKGKVVAKGNNIGGLVGSGVLCSISNSYSKVEVVSQGFNTGGLVGFGNTFSVSRSFNSGTVISEQDNVGGILGHAINLSIVESYNIGSVFGRSNIGGIIGFNSGGFISVSYNAGHVKAIEDNSGGLTGYHEHGSANSSYWDTKASGQSSSPVGQGRTTEEMTYPHSANTYTSWNFDNVWANDINHFVNFGYPYLREIPLSTENEIYPVTSIDYIYNYPNPFNPETTIIFSLTENSSQISLRIYNIQGQLVKTLIENIAYSKGIHRVVWEGKNDDSLYVATGVYFYRLTTENTSVIRKMLFLR